MYKISVIIPTYNAEKTIHRSVKSILNQNWRGNLIEDIEIILVDDCSNDGTKKIIEKFANSYENIASFSTNKNSKSPSIPRNIGIQKSNGKYLMFMDNDDEFCPDICETLYSTISNENVDVVSCNHLDIDSIGTIKRQRRIDGLNVNFTNNYVTLDSNQAIWSADFLIWTKIFKKSKIIENKICFPLKPHEDLYFCVDLFLNIDKMIYLKDVYGVKRHIYENSLSNSDGINYIIECLDSYMDLETIYKDNPRINIPKFKSISISSNVKFIIIKIASLEKFKDKKVVLQKLYDYEKYSEFNNQFNELIFKIINFFILNKMFILSILVIDIIFYFKKSSTFRKIYRIIHNN